MVEVPCAGSTCVGFSGAGLAVEVVVSGLAVAYHFVNVILRSLKA